jgi:gas vesicle protein
MKGGVMRNYLHWKKESNSTGKVIIGAVAGMAVGLTAGILTAPRPGKEIRDMLSSRTSKAIEKIGETITENKNKE